MMYIDARPAARVLNSGEELFVKQEEKQLKIPFVHSAQLAKKIFIY